MLKNYFKVAVRFFTRQKSYTFINIAGLAIGMAATIMILIYVFFELGFDRHNNDFRNIYRLNFVADIGDTHMDEPVSPSSYAAMVLAEFPQVKTATRIFSAQNRAVKYEENAWYEDHFAFIDTTFFDIFKTEFVTGSEIDCVDRPFTVVITEQTAERYFGNDNAIGKMIKMTNHFGTNTFPDTVFFEVTAVIKEFPPQSHMHFDFLASMGSIPGIAEYQSLVSLNMYTYLRFDESANIQELGDRINTFYVERAGPEFQAIFGMNDEQFSDLEEPPIRLYLSPLTDIHLRSHGKFELEENGNILYIRIFSSIAVLILLLACINFINLSTARSVKRAKEVGIRKVVGSNRKNLVFQFIGESFLLSIISFLIAMMIVEFTMPLFENIMDQKLSGFYLNKSWFWFSCIAIIILVGFLAGLYPALVLSSYKPMDVIRALPFKKNNGFAFRNVLVTFQFIITGTILLAVITVWSQLGYVQKKELGFDKERIMVIERTDPIKNSVEAFMKEVGSLPEVENICLTAGMIGRQSGINAVGYKKDNVVNTLLASFITSNYEFHNVLGIDIIQGRAFSEEFDDSRSLLINETALRELGFENPLEEYLYFGSPDSANTAYRIVGVLKDFHYESLHVQIRPFVLMLNTAYYDGYIMVRLQPGDHLAVAEKVKSVWNRFATTNPLVYYFFDDDFKHLYKEEEQTGKLMELFSFLSIIVAALGLFGLVSYSVTTRIREIGIRKTSGAGTLDIMVLIIRDNIKPIFYSLIISFPLAYLFMTKWLQNFAYRIDINPIWFIVVLFSLFFIGVGTTIFQAGQASRINPAEAVRTE